MKTLLFTLSFLLLGGGLVGCAPAETTPADTIAPQEQADTAEDYVGMTVEAAQELAEENGVPFRVIERDGEPLPATMDWRPGRINASVENNIVVSY